MMVVKIPFTEKPTGSQIALIRKSFNNPSSIVETDPEELCDFISKGFTIAPCVAVNGLKNENFVSGQLIILDIDNDNGGDIITIDEALSNLSKNGFESLLYHESFNHTEEKPKYHIILLLDEPIDDANKMSFAIVTLMSCIGQSDKACKDVARMFFTTNGKKKKVKLLNPNATIKWEDIITYANKLDVQQSSTKNYTRSKELRKLEKEFDLLSYMKIKNTPISGENSNSNYVMFDTCCICGHKKDLCYFKDSNKFSCFGAHGNVNGTIIDYIMYSENKSEKEAIDIFKYELLGLPKEDNDFINKRNYFINIIKDQMLEINFQCDNIDSLTWIEQCKTKNDKIYYQINAPKLSKFFRDNVAYFFVRDHAKGGILRYFYIDGYYKLVNDNEVKGYIKSLIPLELQKFQIINEVFNLLITDLKFISIDKLNADEDIIIFKNGVLHLSTGELTPHSKKYISTIMIPCNYVENAEKPVAGRFDKYMDDLTERNSELKKLYLQAIGMTLSNVYAYRCKQFFVCVGEHNTGKSVIKGVVINLIGENNFSGTDLKEMESRFGKINLLNKRLVGTNDMSFISVPEICVLKQATSGDPISAEFKGENGINFVFRGLIWFCTNELPSWGGDRDSGVYERMNIIECHNVIPEESRDPKLVEHLLEEKEYIVSLAVAELKNVIKNDYKYDIPEICYKWKEQFKVQNNPFLQFMDECVIDRPHPGKIEDDYTCRKFYDVYKEWHKQNCKEGHYETKGEVFKLLNKIGKGDRIKTKNGYWYFKDITINDEIKNEYSYI